jgi:hypothetical protein
MMNTKATAFAILALVALFALAGLVITLSREPSVTGQGFDALSDRNPPYDYPRTTYTATEWEHLEDPESSVWRVHQPRKRYSWHDPYVVQKSAFTGTPLD